MKKLSVFIAIMLCFFAFPSKTQAASSQTVYHFFTHALLADSKLAFSEGNPMRYDYDRDCLTVYEFNSILTELYNNNYVLVDIYDVYKNGQKRVVDVPKGKKPMIFSFDDINYYTKKMNLGMNDRLILDGGGAIATVINGVVSYDNEVITCLENFVQKYPNFSINGAKGMICLTGFDGILGYRTQKDSINGEWERVKAKEIVDALKEKNWRFACHSYAHGHMKTISCERMKYDTKKWQNEVATLVGDTDLYVYPYGEWTMDEKQKTLIESGYKMFFGVGTEPYYTYMPLEKSNEKSLFMDRIPLDGRTLREYPKKLEKYFSASKVYDHIDRFIAF